MRKRMPVATMTDPAILVPAIGEAFRKLDPRLMVRNPVMFAVEVVARADDDPVPPRSRDRRRQATGFSFQINLWLWFTVLFANFAEAVAEGRGKAQAATLRKSQDRDDGQAAVRMPARDMAAVAGDRAEAGRCRAGRGRRSHPVRRRGDRGRGLGQRSGDHRRNARR